MIASGKLRHRVTLQVNNPSDDTAGQPIESWSDVGTFRAEVRGVSGAESIVADRLKITATHAVTMRGVGVQILPDRHRLDFKGRKLAIKVADDVGERGAEWAILAIEVKNPL